MAMLLNGFAELSAMMALPDTKAFEISADTLIRMQAHKDLARAQKREEELHVERVARPVQPPTPNFLHLSEKREHRAAW